MEDAEEAIAKKAAEYSSTYKVYFEKSQPQLTETRNGSVVDITYKIAFEGKDDITFTAGGHTYTVTKQGGTEDAGTVTLVKAKNAKTVTVPDTVTYTDGIKYQVTAIGKNAFAASKARKIVVKTKKLTKASVKVSLKGSKVKTVQVKVGSKKVNKKYVKKYKKYFTKKNAGKKVKVSK